MQRNVKYFRRQLQRTHSKGPKFLCEKDRHEIFLPGLRNPPKSKFELFSFLPEATSDSVVQGSVGQFSSAHHAAAMDAERSPH